MIKDDAPLTESGASSNLEQGVFDLSALEAIFGNNPTQLNILIGLISTLVATGRDDLIRAQDLCNERDFVQAAATLHTLRGAVSAIGAKKFAAASIALEKELRDGGFATRQKFNTADAELSKTLARAAAWLANVEK